MKKQRQLIQHEEEMKILEKENLEKKIKEIKMQKKRQKYENEITDKKNSLINKISQNEERIKKMKLQKEKNLNKKYNKLYM